jgi:hypothetical protein
MKHLIATFDSDTRRCHRFILNEGQIVKGTLYVTKGENIPESVTIKLKTKADQENFEGEEKGRE